MKNISLSSHKFSKKHSEVTFYHIKNYSSQNREYIQGITKNKSTFYLLKFKNGIKLGISNRFPERLREYLKPWCFPIEEVFVITCKNIKDITKKLELSLRRGFKSDVEGSLEFLVDYEFDYIKHCSIKNFKSITKKEYLDSYIDFSTN